MRRFVDAKQKIRCKAVITLRDGTSADCGRKAVLRGLCLQHYKIKAEGKK